MFSGDSKEGVSVTGAWSQKRYLQRKKQREENRTFGGRQSYSEVLWNFCAALTLQGKCVRVKLLRVIFTILYLFFIILLLTFPDKYYTILIKVRTLVR